MVECGVGGTYGNGEVGIDEKKGYFQIENATVHEFLK